ncbi:MAG: hypothetical protein ACI4TU_04080 [Candidatus Cryptobacteroides sp.]
MKSNVLKLTAVILGVLTIVSCSKEGIKGFEGRYSYKISGKVALLPTDYVNASEQEKELMESMGIVFTETWVPLYPEQGQMHINIMDKDAEAAMVTFNDISSNVCKTTALVDGDDIVLDEAEKTAFLTDGSEKIASGFVRFKGKGSKYGNQLIFALEYAGTIVVEGTEMTIVASNVDCIGTEN